MCLIISAVKQILHLLTKALELLWKLGQLYYWLINFLILLIKKKPASRLL